VKSIKKPFKIVPLLAQNKESLISGSSRGDFWQPF